MFFCFVGGRQYSRSGRHSCSVGRGHHHWKEQEKKMVLQRFRSSSPPGVRVPVPPSTSHFSFWYSRYWRVPSHFTCWYSRYSLLVISAFGTLGTREHSFSFWYSRYSRVLKSSQLSVLQGLASTQSFQPLVLQVLTTTQSFQPLVLQILARTQSFQQVLATTRSFQLLVLQGLSLIHI